jgi:hypothetical protein
MKGTALDPRGHIYEDSPEKPVTAEDKARLDGFLKAKAQADKEELLKEKLAKFQEEADRIAS